MTKNAVMNEQRRQSSVAFVVKVIEAVELLISESDLLLSEDEELATANPCLHCSKGSNNKNHDLSSSPRNRWMQRGVLATTLSASQQWPRSSFLLDYAPPAAHHPRHDPAAAQRGVQQQQEQEQQTTPEEGTRRAFIVATRNQEAIMLRLWSKKSLP